MHNTFNHSVKVPRLYKLAAKILQEVKENRGSLKQLLYPNKFYNVKAVYALVVETLKHYSQIDSIIEQSGLLIKENRFNPWLARIFVTEMLWNGKPLGGESKPTQTIMSYYDVMKTLKSNLNSNTEQKITKKVQKPRFVRINTLLTTSEEVINGFRDEEWILMPSSGQTYNEYLSKANTLGPDEFMIDLHIKELLLFPCNTEFYKHFAYRNGLIILQDKASCLPAYLLNPVPGSTVLDMCAAPGMKTTHLAALLNNEGTVFAIERDIKRFQTLNKMVESAGATCVKTINKDVLHITADDCPNVEYILVDPSCSGSGIANRIEINDEDTTADPVRLKRLTNFQATILKHAFTNFPQAKRIVYSTCSVYPEENENVVREVKDFNNFQLISAKNLLGGPWKNVESDPHDEITDKCLFTKPEEDLTNGFFVAVFERKEAEVDNSKKNLSMDTCQKSKEEKKNKHVCEDEVKDVMNESDVTNVKECSRKRKSSAKIDNIDEESNILEEDHEHISKKKRKKVIQEELSISENNTENYYNTELNEEIFSSSSTHKKSKKKKNKQTAAEEIVEDKTEKKKKRKNVEPSLESDNAEEIVEDKAEKKKKRKKVEPSWESGNVEEIVEDKTEKKKKKNKRVEASLMSENVEPVYEEKPKKKSKKHKKVQKDEDIIEQEKQKDKKKS